MPLQLLDALGVVNKRKRNGGTTTMDTDIESKTGFPIIVAKGNEGLTEQTYCRQFAGQLRRRQDDVPKVCEHVNVDSIQEQDGSHREREDASQRVRLIVANASPEFLC